MIDTNHRKFGSEAERSAAEYLISKNYTILEHNYHYSHKEIDIIARKQDTIIFVEVKAARSDKFGSPESWVTPAKQKNIIEVATYYLSQHDTGNCDFRFDVITYLQIQNQIKLNHLEGAFYAEENP